MAETKYGKYFISGPKAGAEGVQKDHIAHLDGDVIEGGLHFVFTFLYPSRLPGVHGPHTHDHPEILGFFSCDPDDPYNLGAELELCMGEEMEKHTITKSTVVYIPPGLVHSPLVHKRADRPYIFVFTVPAPKIQETHLKHLIPEAEREKMVWPEH